MSDADQLRDRATRLLALALKARDNGHFEYADELTQLASEAFDQAADMERRMVSDPKTPPQ
jgi:cellobiose-specific phosphotransferase system component IIA